MTPKEETEKRKAKEALIYKLVYRQEFVAFNKWDPQKGGLKNIPGEIIEALSPEEREIAKTLTAEDFGYAKNRHAHWTAGACQQWHDERKQREWRAEYKRWMHELGHDWYE